MSNCIWKKVRDNMKYDNKTLRYTFECPEDLHNGMLVKWIAALRSGKFKQRVGAMSYANIPTSACCLHVAACAVDGIDWMHGAGCAMPDDLEVAAPFALAVSNIAFSVKDVGTGHSVSATPADLNDEYELSFLEIAELLEKGTLTRVAITS